MAFKPTDSQRLAINVPSGALVAAAAGSGKTAVLVERVIRQLCGENPINAARLLVVTFTNAAAEEMYTRIEKRLNEECLKNPQNYFLVKQKMQLRNAKICTIDSFCIELVRENFDKLGINPDFTIADESYLFLLSENSLSEVLDNNFNRKDPCFQELLGAVSNDFDEGNLRSYIKDIYKESQRMPFPREWINECIEKCTDAEFQKRLIDEAFCFAEEVLTKGIENFKSAIDSLITYTEIYEKYAPNYTLGISDMSILLEYCKQRNWDKVHTLASTFKFPALPGVKGAKDIAVVTGVQAVKSETKAAIDKIAQLFYADFGTVLKDIVTGERFTKHLLELTAEYMEIYDAKRRENNVMTFDDTEHLALSLLCEYKDGEIVKKDCADDIIGRFDEVLVDEFQDTNNMQDILFSALSGDESKLFVVGDLKQSIYRFRGANPKNFLEKKDRYAPAGTVPDSDLKKVILGNNFRSRAGICEFVNFFFSIMMNGKKSSLRYDEEDTLIASAKYEERDENDVEISLVSVPTGGDVDASDAKNIAAFIHRYMENGMITDKATRKTRKPQFSDFTILFRNLASKGTKYAQYLEEYGIPVSYNLDGYLKTAEVQMMLSLLKVIENPTRDIELVAVLMSPIFMFTAEELANIKLMRVRGSLISSVIAKANTGDVKCADFIKKLNRFSNMAATCSVSDLISFLYDETGILNIVSVLENGEGRRNNLIMLSSLAAAYDTNNSSNNLTQFTDYIIKLADKNIKAAGSAAGEDSVKLMTIHKSKGLQFPVCIIADASGGFSSSDTSSAILIDHEYGVSVKYYDTVNDTKKSPLKREIMSLAAAKEQIAEELRLLYVAMTRAEEKLFISVTAKDMDSRIKRYALELGAAETPDDYTELISYGNSYAGLLYPVLLLHQSFNKLRVSYGISGIVKPTELGIDVSLISPDSITLPDIKQKIANETVECDNELADKISAAITYKYPYESLKNIESKASVTEVAHKAEKGEYSFSSLPAFLSKKGMTPAQIGTATHRFMQFADLSLAEADLSAEIDRLYEWEFITLKEKEAIDTQSVRKFFQSDVYRRMKASSRVEREMRFLTEISAGSINPELDSAVRDEKIVVQGSVDCVFVEDDGIVVVDFKTDRISNENDLSVAYGEQLDIYAKACEKIFELPVKQKLIYSFALSSEVEMK